MAVMKAVRLVEKMVGKRAECWAVKMVELMAG
jgi:hypothetical protein